MTMTMRLIFLCMLVVIPCVIQGQSRARHQAEEIAKKYLQQYNISSTANARLMSKNRLVCSVASKESGLNESPYYVFTDTLANCFVIVSGDERMKDILGFCTNDVYKKDEVPCGLSALLSLYAEQYAYLKNNGSEDKDLQQEKSKESIPDVEPIITSKWGQYSPYNDQCPGGCPSGCVATAMSQIMWYYKYPDTGVGQFEYTSQTRKYHLSYDFSHANFAWSDMQDMYDSYSVSNSASRKAVANLMSACGVSVGMDYDSSGSGAYHFDVPYALIHFFKYNKNMASYERDYFKTSDWYDLVFEELKANRPILYCGADKSLGGHAFIVDGYRQSDGMFHVNWGWNGRYDGYYELDALDSPNGKYSTGQSMIAGFCPEEIGKAEDTFYAELFTHSGNVKAGENVEFTMTGVENLSNSSSYVVNNYFEGVIGIGLYDSTYNYIRSLSEERIKIKTAAMQRKFTKKVQIPSDATGQYIAAFVKSDSATTPTVIRTIGGLTDFYLVDGNNGDEPDVDDKEVLLSEDFEGFTLPKGWSQEYMQGKGFWAAKTVLSGNDNSSTPNPAKGNGYVFLSYDSGTIFANTPSVTRLKTDVLSGISGQEYYLSFQCRKYASQAGKKEILSVYIDKGCNGQWEELTEYSIPNANSWFTLEIPYFADGPYKLAIEGSLEYGSNIFIDDMEVSRLKGTSAVRPVHSSYINNNADVYYDLGGHRFERPSSGIHIIRKTDGTSKKVFVKN